MPAPLETTIAPPEVTGITPFDQELADALSGGHLLTAPETAEEEAEPETEPVAETETEVEDTPEPAEEGEESGAESPEGGWPESAQKRVDKLTALKGDAERERDTLKDRVTTLETQLAEAKAAGPAPAPAPTPENPLAHVLEERDLAVHANFNQEIADWAIENLTTGGTLPAEFDAILTGRTVDEAKAEPREFDPRQAAGLLKVAQRRLSRDIPARQQWLRVDKQAAAYVGEHYPQMLKADSEEGKLFAQFEREIPEIKRLPTWRVALVDAVRGAQLRIAEEKQRAESKGAAPTGATAPKQASASTAKVPIAPVLPGAPRGTGARPAAAKPRPASKLKASMTPDELAAAL